MNKFLIILILVFSVVIVRAASVMYPLDGGTGTGSTPSTGDILVGQSDGTYSPQATSTLGLGATPAGSDTQVQYNNGGLFAGDSNFTWTSSTQTLSVATSTVTGNGIFNDDVVISFGTGRDIGFINRSTSLGANTVLTNVLVGTPVTFALAANSLIIGNITASGDIMIAANRGGNSEDYFFADASAGTLELTAPAGTLSLNSTLGAVNVILGSGGGDDFNVASGVFVVEGDTGNVGIGTASPSQLFDVSDGSVSYYLVDTRTGTTNTFSHEFDTSNTSMVNIVSVEHSLMQLTGYTLDVTTDNDDITASFGTQLSVKPSLLTSASSSTNYTGIVSSLQIAGPSASTNVILDHMAAIHIDDGGAGDETIQSGIMMNTLTGGTTNYMLTLGSTDADHNLIHVGVTGDPIFSWDESEDIFNINKGLSVTSGNVGIGTSTPATLFTVATTTNIFNVLSSGNVGIGILTPSENLEVSENAGAIVDTTNFISINTVIDSSVASQQGLIIQKTDTSSRGFQLYQTGTSDGNSFFNIGSFSGGAITDRLTIRRNNGNVGIGLTAPTSLFHINATGTLAIPISANPTLDGEGELAIEDDQSAIKFYAAGAERSLRSEKVGCTAIENLAATDDNMLLASWPYPVTIISGWGHCRGTCTTNATIDFEDSDSNAMTMTDFTTTDWGTEPASTTVTSGGGLIAFEGFEFDVTNAVDPETDEYLICFAYRIDP